MTTKTTTQKQAIATAENETGTIFSVRYPGHRDMDRDVSYEYLRRLVRQGYQVTVEASATREGYQVS